MKVIFRLNILLIILTIWTYNKEAKPASTPAASGAYGASTPPESKEGVRSTCGAATPLELQTRINIAERQSNEAKKIITDQGWDKLLPQQKQYIGTLIYHKLNKKFGNRNAISDEVLNKSIQAVPGLPKIMNWIFESRDNIGIALQLMLQLHPNQ